MGPYCGTQSWRFKFQGLNFPERFTWDGRNRISSVHIAFQLVIVVLKAIPVLLLTGTLGFKFTVHFVAYNITTVKHIWKDYCPFLSTKALQMTYKHRCFYSFGENLKYKNGTAQISVQLSINEHSLSHWANWDTWINRAIFKKFLCFCNIINPNNLCE